MLDIKITKTTHPKEKPQDESKLGFGKKFSDHMFLMDYTEGEGWHDARIVPYGPWEMDPATTVFHYAQEIFEGMKSKFEWRCDGFDRMGMAGVHSIGMGVLIGLEKEWRTDVVMMAHHLRYLQKHYWKTKYSVNFPRMRPAQNEGFQPNCYMTDKQLAQATFAMRIFDHDVDISYSTREPAYIRDNMATLGVTTMSAESKVNPGGYHTYPQALEQFTVSDERTAKVINARLKELGREPVWKDWDASFDFFGNIANG